MYSRTIFTGTLLIFISACHAESATFVPLPIIQALTAGEQFFGGNKHWTAVNENQQHFLKQYNPHRRSLSHFNDTELQAWVSYNADELNDIASQKGFSITFEPFAPNEFGILSILDVVLTWLEKGTENSVRSKIDATHEQIFKAVRLEKGVTVYYPHNSLHRFPIVRVESNGPDTVYMTIANEQLEGFALAEKIKELKQTMAPQPKLEADAELIFPVVNLDQKVDIGWLLGMHQYVGGDKFTITQAKQQTKLKLDESGAHVESAVMIAIECTSCGFEPEPIVIDKPFYIWIERAGCQSPILYGYIDTDCWEQLGTAGE